MRKSEDERHKAYSGFRWLSLDGKIQRRLVYVCGDKAFVVAKPNRSFRATASERARVVSPDAVFHTEAEANGGADRDVFVTHNGVFWYEKLKARTSKMSPSKTLSVSSTGALRAIHGNIFETEAEAAEWCLKEAQAVLAQAAGDVRKARDQSRRAKKGKHARKARSKGSRY